MSDLTAAEYIHLRHISLTGKKAADELDRLRRELADRHGECCCVTHGEVAHMLHCAVCVDGLRRELAEAREAKYVVMLLRKYSPSLCADFEKDARAAMAEPKEGEK